MMLYLNLEIWLLVETKEYGGFDWADYFEEDSKEWRCLDFLTNLLVKFELQLE